MVDPVKNGTEGENMRSYQRLVDYLHTKCIFIKKNILYNKASVKYIEVIKKTKWDMI